MAHEPRVFVSASQHPDKVSSHMLMVISGRSPALGGLLDLVQQAKSPFRELTVSEYVQYDAGYTSYANIKGHGG